jgi:hypothetical protein
MKLLDVCEFGMQAELVFAAHQYLFTFTSILMMFCYLRTNTIEE